MNGTIEQRQLRASGPTPLTAWSDENLLLSYRSEPDNAVFEELVRRYEKELYGYLRHYLGDAERAADVFQQTFLQVHLKCEQFEPGRKVRPWLYTVALNQAIDYQRRNRRHRMNSLDRAAHGQWDDDSATLADRLSGASAAPDDDLQSAEQNEMVRKAIESLPPLCREVVTLVYLQGLKYREAAEVLSVPVGTVKSRLHFAMDKLAESLATLKL